MNYELASKLFEEIKKSSKKEKILQELFDEFALNAIDYSQIRVEWHLLDLSEKRKIEDKRAGKHDVLIDSINILSRAFMKYDLDNSWRNKLGDDRKVLGDFGCYVNAILGIKAR